MTKTNRLGKESPEQQEIMHEDEETIHHYKGETHQILTHSNYLRLALSFQEWSFMTQGMFTEQ